MARPQRRTTAAAGALSPVTLSVFDLDRTLTRLPTYSRFLLFAARSRAPWRLLLLPLLLPVALLYALKIVPRRTMKQAMHRIAIGRALPQREAARLAARSEARRGGNGCVSTCRSRWSPSHQKKNKTRRNNP